MDLSYVTGTASRSPAQGRRASDEELNSGAGGHHVSGDQYPSYEERGRWYHGFRKGVYMYPCDETEQDRLDLMHKLLSVARVERLHDPHVRIPPPPPNGVMARGQSPRILDLGCGTGIWAIDMAKEYPHAYVLGTDLAPMQPNNPPPNCEFQSSRDYESPWLLGEDSWDFIHLQLACGSVSSWPNLYSKVFAHLKPGTGYFEQVEIDFEPRSYDAPLNGPLVDWYHHLKEATDQAKKPIAFNRSTEHMLKEAGFVDVTHEVIGLPLNEWPPDQHEKLVGKWYSLAFTESALTLLQGPLTRISQWPLANVRQLADQAVSQAYNPNVRAFHYLQIYTGRKPR
ncbi:hypothetical protein FQN57_004721 [Myotisia sp. PD_48]|nr:hypothetical protein FQN57_004721 [Myotisia sp. PD_48]